MEYISSNLQRTKKNRFSHKIGVTKPLWLWYDDNHHYCHLWSKWWDIWPSSMIIYYHLLSINHYHHLLSKWWDIYLYKWMVMFHSYGYIYHNNYILFTIIITRLNTTITYNIIDTSITYSTIIIIIYHNIITISINVWLPGSDLQTALSQRQFGRALAPLAAPAKAVAFKGLATWPWWWTMVNFRKIADLMDVYGDNSG